MAISKATLLNTMKEARKMQDTRNATKYVAQEDGKGLSTNDYTTEAKTKLDGVAEGAQVNVIESVTVKGETITTITGKNVELDLDAYAKKSDMTAVLKYKGSKDSYAGLPAEGNALGDVWNIAKADKTHNVKAGDNVAWNGENWDVLAGTEDLSGYVEKADGKVLSSNDYTDEEKAQLAALEANKDEQVTGEDIASIFADA